ncbi:hypothetical protein E6O75_ATG05948 [Venturia nashicola]|uniref:Uncharacterized protein n=1 Tax=Venturia nashicola TaxID=86259 RepID=A0A4Z1NW24_9PEZI|nr:hypothetical protein E6O75_ATG05948 [Venturia nashicola]
MHRRGDMDGVEHRSRELVGVRSSPHLLLLLLLGRRNTTDPLLTAATDCSKTGQPLGMLIKRSRVACKGDACEIASNRSLASIPILVTLMFLSHSEYVTCTASQNKAGHEFADVPYSIR